MKWIPTLTIPPDPTTHTGTHTHSSKKWKTSSFQSEYLRILTHSLRSTILTKKKKLSKNFQSNLTSYKLSSTWTISKQIFPLHQWYLKFTVRNYTCCSPYVCKAVFSLGESLTHRTCVEKLPSWHSVLSEVYFIWDDITWRNCDRHGRKGTWSNISGGEGIFTIYLWSLETNRTIS